MRRLPLLLIAALAAGCATVKPFDRARLADPVMQPELIPECVAIDQHVLATLEASQGGYGVVGGGCGCN